GALHPVAVAVDCGRLEPVGLPRDPGEPRAGPLDRGLDHLVELELLLLDLRPTAGELEKPGDERAHLLRLPVEVVEQLPALLRLECDVAAEDVDVRLQA